MELDIPEGKQIKKNYVGKNLKNYDSMLVLSHFKGHPMGGYGGAIKQLSIGVASSYGKKYIHGVGDVNNFWGSDHDSFLEAMADAAKSVVDFFDGKIYLTFDRERTGAKEIRLLVFTEDDIISPDTTLHSVIISKP